MVNVFLALPGIVPKSQKVLAIQGLHVSPHGQLGATGDIHTLVVVC